MHPVLIEPLEREWADLREEVTHLLAGVDLERKVSGKEKEARTKALGRATELVIRFLTRLNEIRVLALSQVLPGVSKAGNEPARAA